MKVLSMKFHEVMFLSKRCNENIVKLNGYVQLTKIGRHTIQSSDQY